MNARPVIIRALVTCLAMLASVAAIASLVHIRTIEREAIQLEQEQ